MALPCAALLALSTLPASPVTATPVFVSPDNCAVSSSNTSNWVQPGDRTIYYYVESTMGTWMRDCLLNDLDAPNGNLESTSNLVNHPTSTLNSNVVHSVISAAEVWNQQSRGKVLVYGGAVTMPIAETDYVGWETLCNSIQKPAVLVMFRPGCFFDGTACDSITRGLFGGVPSLWQCGAEVSRIRFFGDQNHQNQCQDWDIVSENGNLVYQETGVAPQWNVIDHEADTRIDQLDIKEVAVHEFGHALGLGHSHQQWDDTSIELTVDPAYGYSVMSHRNNDPEYNTGSILRRHLSTWDVDCVDDVDPVSPARFHRGERLANWAWIGFSSTGAPSARSAWLISTPVGAWSGGFLTDSSLSNFRYGLYRRTDLHTVSVTTNGYIPWNDPMDFVTYPLPSGPNGEFQNPYSSPLVLTTAEHTSSHQRLVYNGIPLVMPDTSMYPLPPAPITPDQNPFFTLEPPLIRNTRSSNFFATTTAAQTFQACTANCLPAEDLRSYLPMSSAWDEVSGNTVMARVQTPRDNETTYGDIHLYPGFFSLNRLRQPTGALRTLITPPSDAYADQNFTLKTEWPVGVACAPVASHAAFPNNFNCLLVWIDLGIAESRMLYTYFRVTGTNTIEFAPTASGSRSWGLLFSSAMAHGGVSAAWFNNRFYVGWKHRPSSTSSTMTIAWSSSSAVRTWNALTTVAGVVNPLHRPTFFYVPHMTREAALVWTEAL